MAFFAVLFGEGGWEGGGGRRKRRRDGYRRLGRETREEEKRREEKRGEEKRGQEKRSEDKRSEELKHGSWDIYWTGQDRTGQDTQGRDGQEHADDMEMQQETLNFWKQLTHVLKYFRAEEDPKGSTLPKNFIQGFIEVRADPEIQPVGTEWRASGMALTCR